MSVSATILISTTLVSATPIALAGIGGLFGERSGISNIGLEGTMTFGAFAAAAGAYYSGNPWIGLLTGALIGILISLIHAFFCITMKVDHTVIGLAVNILASSATVYFCAILFGNKGSTPNVSKLPQVSIPFLRKLPGVGTIFSDLSLLTIIAVLFAVAATFMIYKTNYGSHISAVGSSTQVAYVAGIKVKRIQYSAVMIGGLMCGLGGAFLSISYLNMYVREMVAGRGFIAIAAILFGRYHPLGVLGAALFFGFASALQMSLQGSVNVSNELIQAIPYILTIVAVAISGYLKKKNSGKLNVELGDI